MNRDETIELWQRCEDVREQAIADGKTRDQAHEEAKRIWNGWASQILEIRYKLVLSGQLILRKRRGDDFIVSWKVASNEETEQFLKISKVEFTEFEFAGMADFRDFIFPGEAIFGRVGPGVSNNIERELSPSIFSGFVTFWGAKFYGDARFDWVIFSKNTNFSQAEFLSDAGFDQAKFNGVLWCVQTSFFGEVWFGQVDFENYADFHSSQFRDITSFQGAVAQRAFILRGCGFRKTVPDFRQAKFNEAPDLDNVEFPIPGWFGSRSQDSASKYRAVRRLAVQGHDYETESSAFKAEIRSKRFRTDWPWRPAFWFGTIYDLFADFGRSAFRPFFGWALCIVAFAIYFLGQNPEIAAEKKKLHRHGFFGQAVAYSTVAWNAVWQTRWPECLSEERVKDWNGRKLGANEKGDGFTGLADLVRGQTNILNEAFSIAYHNAVIVLDSSGDSSHRAFGCLYGVERYGGNPVAYVPRSVAIASGIQKFLSAIFIFLFGLAVRNMLKVK